MALVATHHPVPNTIQTPARLQRKPPAETSRSTLRDPQPDRPQSLFQVRALGATAVIRHASKLGACLTSPWLTQLLVRKPRKLAAVALANKTARIVWAMMARGKA